MPTTRLKYMYKVVDQRAGSDQPPLLSVSIHRGVVPREALTDKLARAEDLSNYKLCELGDIVLNRMRAFQGAIGISPVRGLVSPDYMVIRPLESVDARYLHHLFRSAWFVGEMTSKLRGIGSVDLGAVRTPRINPEDLGDIEVTFPSIAEQRRIATFLDVETGRIDQLVDLQGQVRERLEERNRILLDSELDVIHDKNGSIPFRRFILGMDQGSSPQCDSSPADEAEWGVLKVSAIRPGKFLPGENKRLPGDVAPDVNSEVRRGDLLITRANTPVLVGATVVVPAVRKKLLLSDKIFRVRVSTDLDPRYVALVARASRVRSLREAASHGASQSMANLRFEDIKEWGIPIATLPEQRKVVERLAANEARADELREQIGRQISLLSERRQSLITAAVTGEIDVATGRGISAQ